MRLTYRSGLRDHFDSSGKLTSVVDRNGKGVTIGYGSDGIRSTITDASGRVVTLQHTNGKLTQIQLPDGRSVSFTYDPYSCGALKTVTGPNGGVTTYWYAGLNGHCLMYQIKDADNHWVVRLGYDANNPGRVNLIQDPLGNYTTIGWNATTNTATITDANNHVWKDVYSPDHVLQQTIDPYGKTVSYTHDPSSQLLTGYADPLGNQLSL